MSNHRLIDIDEILRKKLGRKYNYIPKFLIRSFEKFIHQDYINSFIKNNYEGTEFCVKSIEYLGIKCEFEGLENLPEDEKKYIFVSNHPLGAVDGLILAGLLGEKYDNKINFLVNDFLMYIDAIAPMCAPVNKVGAQSRDLPKLVNEIYQSDKQVLLFPAGICSRKRDGKVQDVEWTKSFIPKSIQSNRNIVPIRFIGENTKRFYRIAKISDFFRLKFNIAMLFLPDEMYKARGNTYKIIIGKPIPISTVNKSKTPSQWAQYFRSIVYNL